VASDLAMVNKAFTVAGTVRDYYGDDVEVSVSPDGDVLIAVTLNDEDEPQTLTAVLDPAMRDKLRELLDRAAMPGQEAHGG
jgi:hypothetical protein